MSRFVGLVLRSVPVPVVPSPPINSLPPRRCPPGLVGIDIAGDVGEFEGRGLVNCDLLIEVGETPPKLKLGRGGGRFRTTRIPSSVLVNCSTLGDPIARRLPRDMEDGAEEVDCRAGKTKGGLGRGPGLAGFDVVCVEKYVEVGDGSSSS